MEINDALVDKLANLSRLHFTDIQKKEILSDLEKMIGFVDKLNELDTTGIQPLMHINPASDILREDLSGEYSDPADAMKNAPEKHDHFFTVPKVIQK